MEGHGCPHGDGQAYEQGHDKPGAARDVVARHRVEDGGSQRHAGHQQHEHGDEHGLDSHVWHKPVEQGACQGSCKRLAHRMLR